MNQSSARVKAYYDNNTRRFLKLGKNQNTGNIHQALWAPGVKSFDDAINYSNQLIVDQIEGMPQDRKLEVLDLGCGVGSSLRYVARKTDERVHLRGVTISPTQIEIGRQLIEQDMLADRCRMIEADFLELPEEIQDLDLAYSIEAYNHAASPEGFLASIAGRLRTGGRLLMVDDFLGEHIDRDNYSEKNKQLMFDYREGWLAFSLLKKSETEEMAADYGLKPVSDQDLTPFMELGRPRDKFIELMYNLGRKAMMKSLYMQSLVGGHAKQVLLREKTIWYGTAVWEKI
ncbi:MAG: class I SAM-dependent methyltransferase [Bacteroidota bacterium]